MTALAPVSSKTPFTVDARHAASQSDVCDGASGGMRVKAILRKSAPSSVFRFRRRRATTPKVRGEREVELARHGRTGLVVAAAGWSAWDPLGNFSAMPNESSR